MNDTRYDINVAFKPLYTSDKRYFLVTGGRGSLKSHSVQDFICRLTYQQNQGILFSRFTMTSAETSIIPEFQKAIDRLGLTEDFQINKREIVNKKTGSYVWFRGLMSSSNSTTANLKSLSGITTWIVDEAEDLKDEKLFDKVDDSIRTAGIQNRVILIMNPTIREHWIYGRWFKNSNRNKLVDGYNVEVSSHLKLEHIHTTYHIGERYLSKDWIEKANSWRVKAKFGYDPVTLVILTDREKKEAERYYVNNYLGGWKTQADDLVFENWREGEFDESLISGHGLDFGYVKDPDALVRVAIDKKRKLIYVKELMYKNGQSTDMLGQRLKLHCLDSEIIADSAEPRLIGDLRRDYELHIKAAVKGKGSINSGIKIIKGYTLIVDPSSFNLKTELNQYKWADKKLEIPEDEYNHLIDAIRYYVYYKLRKRKPMTVRTN